MHSRTRERGDLRTAHPQQKSDPLRTRTPTTTWNWNVNGLLDEKGTVGTFNNCSTSCGSQSGVRGEFSRKILGTSITCSATTGRNVRKNCQHVHQTVVHRLRHRSIEHRHRNECLDHLLHGVPQNLVLCSSRLGQAGQQRSARLLLARLGELWLGRRAMISLTCSKLSVHQMLQCLSKEGSHTKQLEVRCLRWCARYVS